MQFLLLLLTTTGVSCTTITSLYHTTGNSTSSTIMPLATTRVPPAIHTSPPANVYRSNDTQKTPLAIAPFYSMVSTSSTKLTGNSTFMASGQARESERRTTTVASTTRQQETKASLAQGSNDQNGGSKAALPSWRFWVAAFFTTLSSIRMRNVV